MLSRIRYSFENRDSDASLIQPALFFFFFLDKIRFAQFLRHGVTTLSDNDCLCQSRKASFATLAVVMRQMRPGAILHGKIMFPEAVIYASAGLSDVHLTAEAVIEVSREHLGYRLK